VLPVQDSSVQVGQGRSSPHAGAYGRSTESEAASPAADRPRIRADIVNANCDRRFATVLAARARRREREAESNAPGASSFAGAGRAAAPVSTGAPGQAPDRPAAEAPHRLLVSASPDHDGACLRIERGPFAGTEIHLSVTGSHVELCVLTPHEASRQTLAIAMEAVRTRLRTRGLTMSEASASPGRPGNGRAPARGDGSQFIDSRPDRHDRPTF